MNSLTRCISVVCFITFAFLIGCGATQHIQRGDAALNADRPREALANYQRATQVDGRLRSDPQFAAKLREASWRTAILDADAAAANGNWEAAIHAYEQTVFHNSSHPAAAQGLANAKQQGAQGRYERSLIYADKNDLRSAREDLRQALTWDPNHANARAAFDSLDRKGNAASEQRFAAALTRIEQRDWQRASDELSTNINIDANHLPSRAEIAKAQQMMAQSRQAHEQGSRLLTEKKLDDAIATARRALDIWPTSSEAMDLMQRSQGERDRAESLYLSAKDQVAQGNYEQGIATIAQALDVYPDHAAARKFSGEIRQTAADAHFAQARQKLAAGEIETAANHFRKALAYVPGHRAAQDGLVDVSYAHGLGAEKEGLWGNALLWYMEAAAQKPTGVYKQAEDRARAAIAKQVAFDLALLVIDGRGNTNPDTTAMETQLVAQANKSKPAFVSLVKPQDEAPVNGQFPRPLFKAMMTLRSIEVKQQVLSRDRKNHTYNAVRSVPNPNLPVLERELGRAERDLAFARNRLIRFDCRDCNGRGHTVCGTCRGQKQSQCSACNGSGRIRIKGGGYQICNECNGRPSQQCRTCGGVGHLRCNRCGGRGFYNDYDHDAIHRSEREVIDLRNRLRRESPTIQEQYVVNWPYEQELYRKTGTFDGSVQVEDVQGKATVQSFDVAPIYRNDDVVTINPNPQVGLPADGLDLPSDDAVYRSLLSEAASTTIKGALSTATITRANAYIAQANEHAKNGKTDLDIEARVAAMVLLESTEPAQAKRLLEEIRNPK